jgi:tripartite-type tricarboxylate transporter receptor subunit TctC
MAASLSAQAQDYPGKPVTFITPAAAGNSPDVVTRVVADRLTQIWKQQIVVLNRPGAGGLIAAQAAAGVEKDGYSLYVTQASTRDAGLDLHRPADRAGNLYCTPHLDVVSPS